MIADESDAVTVTFLSMMRAAVRAEPAGADTLGRTVELARRWWGSGDAGDAQLATALRTLHADTDDAQPAADAARRTLPSDADEAVALGAECGRPEPGER
ncbi:hypothetical protein [Micromonospora auratinigra]|uniref:Uncharacterized protein n=1 Tax=Micromonospora auratinigra TaxID=261654 RepID=A0A1A8ZBD7_9ACTN|nr:hypothetical protein [Micromonospora auratinigra]SBT41147.1 hypothetical protein GA0070611_1518 [Micromonospora auratinigra]